MTTQEAFERMLAGLAKQNFQMSVSADSFDEITWSDSVHHPWGDSLCMYAGPDNCRCAIGHLMASREEGMGFDLYNARTHGFANIEILREVAKRHDLPLDFLIDAQSCLHDNFKRQKWQQVGIVHLKSLSSRWAFSGDGEITWSDSVHKFATKFNLTVPHQYGLRIIE